MRPGEQSATIEAETYQKSKIVYLGLLVVPLVTLALGFIINLPLKKIITVQIEQALKANRGCQIHYSDIDVSLFLPKVRILDPVIPGTCFGGLTSLPLKTLELGPTLPSLLPPGPRIGGLIKDKNSKIEVYATLSFGGLSVKIDDTKISSKTLNTLLGGKIQLGGDISIESYASVGTKGLGESDLAVISKNFFIPSQSVQGFILPKLNLKVISLKGKSDSKGKITVQEMILGQKNSPIYANFKGNIRLNNRNPRLSEVDLKGKVKFSEDFLKDFGAISLFMGSAKKDKEGQYTAIIKGRLGGNLIPKFL